MRTRSPLVLLAVLSVVIAACEMGPAIATMASLDPDLGTPTPFVSDPLGSPSPAQAGHADTATPSPWSTAAPSFARGPTGLPDPRRTPGATNPAVTPASLASTACRTGWTSTVRPPVSFTGALKRRQIVEYGYADRDPADYQEDHLIPLSVGGAPSDPRNLWPQPLSARLADGTEVGAAVKDGFELWVHDRLCRGSMTLGDAQASFATDWIAAWEAAGRP